MPRLVLISLVACAGLSAFGSSGALAADFCVGSHPQCPAGATQFDPGLHSSLGGAFKGAREDTDPVSRVYLGQGVFTVTTFTPTSISPGLFDHEVHVIGAGSDLTTIRRDSNHSTQPLLNLEFADRKSTLSGLELAQYGSVPNVISAVRVSGGTVHDVRVRTSLSYPHPPIAALYLSDAGIRDSVISTDADIGLQVDGAGEAITLSNVRVGRNSFDLAHNSVAFRLTGDTTAPVHADRLYSASFDDAMHVLARDTTITNSTLGSDHNDGVALLVESDGATEQQLTINSSTLRGFQAALDVSVKPKEAGDELLSVSVSDSLIDRRRDDGLDLRCHTEDEELAPSVTFARTAYNFSRVDVDGCNFTPPGPEFDSEDLPPSFVDSGFKQAWNSPWLDAAGPALNEGQFDVSGNARFVAGRSPFDPGAAIADLGGEEYQASVPVIELANNAFGIVGSAVAFHARAKDADPYETGQLTYQWNFGDGNVGSGENATHTYAAIGSYSATLVVTDPAGRSSAPAVVGVTVAPPLQPATPKDTRQPTLKVTKRPKSGTSRKASVSFKSDEPATLWCNFNKANRWTRCKSPWRKTVKVGRQKLQLRAIDWAGNVSKTTIVKWTVKKKRR